MTKAAKRKFHYIYKTTCNVTQRFYIGMHSTDDLEDGYKGSGKRLWYSITKHGIENHNTEIIEFLPTRKDLKEREAQIVNEELLGNSSCMNLKLGGEGGWDHLNFDSEIQLKKGLKGQAKMKWLAENDPEWLTKKSERMSEANLKRVADGKHPGWDTEIWIGRKHSEETIKKMKEAKQDFGIGNANSQFGTCWIHHPELSEVKKIKKDELNSWISDGWMKGRKMNNAAVV